jgi:GntR family transcriptional regulator
MEFKENQAIYLQIADHFFDNILQKKWESGDKIPSIREMAVKFEVNPNTTMRTFNFLQDKGIIFNKRGIGYYLSDDGYQKAIDLRKEKFLKEDLPVFIKNMQMLGLTLDDLKEYTKGKNGEAMNN